MPLRYKDLYGIPQSNEMIDYSDDPALIRATPNSDQAIIDSVQPDPKQLVADYLKQKFESSPEEEPIQPEMNQQDDSSLDLINAMKDADTNAALRRATDLVTTTAGGIMTGSAPKISSGSSGGDPLSTSIKMANLDQRNQFHSDKLRQQQAAAELAKRRLENSELRIGENREQFDKKRSDAHNKQFADFAKQTSGISGSSRNTIGRAALTMQASNAVKALAGDAEHWDNLTSQQMYELARAYDRTVSGGNPSITGTAHLVPSSALGNAQAFKQWLSNSPQGLKQKEFVKQMVAGAEREYQVSKKLRDDTLDAYAPGYQHLEELDSDRFNKILSGGKSIFGEDSGPDVKAASIKAEENVEKMIPKKKASSLSGMQDGQIKEVNGHRYMRQNGKWLLQE